MGLGPTWRGRLLCSRCISECGERPEVIQVRYRQFDMLWALTNDYSVSIGRNANIINFPSTFPDYKRILREPFREWAEHALPGEHDSHSVRNGLTNWLSSPFTTRRGIPRYRRRPKVCGRCTGKRSSATSLFRYQPSYTKRCAVDVEELYRAYVE